VRGRPLLYNVFVTRWTEEIVDGIPIFRPSGAPDDLLVAFSGRGVVPPAEPSPTSFLARRFARALRLDGTPLVRATQVHGNRAVTVRESPAAGEAVDAGECDVLATPLSRVALAVQTADCVPILLASATAAAAAHAGWRGTARNAALAAVRALSDLGAEPARLRAWLGPSIGPCCYEIGDDVSARVNQAFSNPGELLIPRNGSLYFDLWDANARLLRELGVGEIEVAGLCTSDHTEDFYSWRRENGS